MSKDNNAVAVQKEAPVAGDSRDDWHPYSVWKQQIQSEDSPAADNTELTGSWKPLAVWQRQIKRV